MACCPCPCHRSIADPDAPDLTDPIAAVTACSRCRGAHAVVFHGPPPPLYPYVPPVAAEPPYESSPDATAGEGDE